jgi:hypothetical protein
MQFRNPCYRSGGQGLCDPEVSPQLATGLSSYQSASHAWRILTRTGRAVSNIGKLAGSVFSRAQVPRCRERYSRCPSER